jgi:PTS system glucose-specific IIA component
MSSPGHPLVVLSPLVGQVLPLSDVPDLVFAEAMVGPGVAVEPDAGRGTAVAPVAGRLVKLHPHAFIVPSGSGRGVLVHLGIDTVELRGEGFELLAAERDDVEVATPVVGWDPGAVREGGRSAICPVVALDAPLDTVTVRSDGRAEQGTELFTWS